MRRDAGEELHVHTICSGDSDNTIGSLVQQIIAIQQGSGAYLQDIAITDHNTLTAIVPFRDELLAACSEAGVMAPEVIPGVEVSLWHDEGNTSRSYHILAYFPVQGPHFEAHIRTLEEGPFGAMLKRINDVKRKRMKHFMRKWIENGLLPSVHPRELEELIWLIDKEVGSHIAQGTKGPAYMRDNAFQVLQSLYTTSEEIREIKNGLNLPKDDQRRKRVHVEYVDIEDKISIVEGLHVIKNIPHAYTFFAHPWNHAVEGSFEPISQLIQDLHAQRLINGIQTQGYEQRTEKRIQGDGTYDRVKIYERITDDRWEQFATAHGMNAVSGSDTHGTHKQGVKVTALPYHQDKFLTKNTSTQQAPTFEQRILP